MTTPTPCSFLAKIVSISTASIVLFGITSCTSQSQLEFAKQNGYKRSDYFGTAQGRNYVPVDVEKPIRPTGREIRLGRPGF